ncbi:MAG: hypothetical protein ACPG8W_26255, partial [Candidatus Promineifilaceae bacterium]
LVDERLQVDSVATTLSLTLKEVLNELLRLASEQAGVIVLTCTEVNAVASSLLSEFTQAKCICVDYSHADWLSQGGKLVRLVKTVNKHNFPLLDIPQRSVEILSLPFGRKSFLTWVNWLDILPICGKWRKLRSQYVMRSMVALGYQYLVSVETEKAAHIMDTIRLMEDLIVNPAVDDGTDDDDRHEQLIETVSYKSLPIGFVDMCYGVDDLGGHKWGGGCGSMAGALNVPVLGDELIMQCIAADLIPWLKGNADPLVLRMTQASF